MLYIVRATLLLILIIVYTLTFLTIKGVYMFYSTGYLCALALMLVAVAALFNGAIDIYGFIACILCGTATGVYFVYREFKGE